MKLAELQKGIEDLYDSDRSSLQSPAAKKLVDETLDLLDEGKVRAAEPDGDGWKANAWVKKAILLSFGTQSMEFSEAGPFAYHDKIPLKNRENLHGCRVVPGAIIRRGAFVAPRAVLMPSFVNIGAYVGEGTMVDTWATVGSCAQIGKRVHLSGGVGIGGVLEPPQAAPVVIEDDVFVGSRAIVVEGVRVRKGAVLGANVVLTASTKILDVRGAQAVELKDVIPERCVVIPGMRSRKFAAGEFGVPCALVIGERKASTDEKTSLNEALRDFQIDV